MIKMKHLILALAAIAGGAATAQATTFQAANSYAVEQLLQPGYAKFNQAAVDLDGTVNRYCGDPAGGDADMLAQAYDKAMLAWQSVQHMRSGPIEEQDRQFRIHFWPDKRNRSAKALSKLRAAVEGGQSLEQGLFSQQSVAVQGLPALDRIIADLPLDGTDCKIAKAISGNLAAMAKDLDAAWHSKDYDSYRRQILEADAGTDLFSRPKEASFELFKTLMTGLQWVEENKLKRPLGDSLEKAKPKRAEAWRTGRSTRYLQENVTVLAQLYGIPDLKAEGPADAAAGFRAMLQEMEEGGEETDAKITAGFREIRSLLAGLEMPLSKAVEDPEARLTLEQVMKRLKEVREIVEKEMGTHLGFSMGFNSLDGD